MKRGFKGLWKLTFFVAIIFLVSCGGTTVCGEGEKCFCDKPTAIGGTIVDGSTGQALSGVSVSFFLPTGYFSLKKYKNMQTSAVTDASGNWQMLGIPPEIGIRLVFALSGFKTYEVDIVTPECKVFKNVATALYAYFTMDEDPSNIVEGYVTDGLIGTAISETTVNLKIGVAGSLSTATDSNGYWIIAGLPANSEFELVFSKTNYTSLSQTITTGSNHSRVVQDVELFQYFSMDRDPTNTVEGRVIDGLTDAAIPEVAVSLKIDSDTKIDALTDTQGYYSISGLPCNTEFEVTFTKTNYTTLKASVTTDSDHSRVLKDVSLFQYFTENDSPWSSVIGALYDSFTQLPVSGALIHIEYRQGTITMDATSDTQGKFAINGLPSAESFNITISKTGYRTLSGNNITWSGWQDIYMDPPATLILEVADPYGVPLASARVIVIPDCFGNLCDSGADIATGANGTVDVTVSLGGQYDILALNSGGTMRGTEDNFYVQYSSTYLGVECAALSVDNSLNQISSNDGDDSAGAVLKLVFDQPVSVGSVSGWCIDHDGGGLTLDTTLPNTGATATRAFGNYQVLIQPKVASTSPEGLETDDFCLFDYSVVSTAVTGATYMGMGSVTVP